MLLFKTVECFVDLERFFKTNLPKVTLMVVKVGDPWSRVNKVNPQPYKQTFMVSMCNTFLSFVTVEKPALLIVIIYMYVV